jgi:hypothetical protein
VSAEAPRRRAIRVATAGWLLGWYWKVAFNVGHLRESFAWPIDVPWLPSLLRSPAVAALAYALPLAGAAALWMGGRRARVAGAALLAVAAAIGCVHVELFNDATFVTSFWAALWIAWLAAAPDDELGRHGPLLARCVVAFVFFAGAVGKLNGTYLSGEAFYHLYFVQKDSWPYGALRAGVSDGTLHALARWFSRAVIAGELGLALGPLVPHRAYVWAACAIIAFMVLSSTFYLLSVLAALAAVLVASSLLAGAPQRATSR